MEQVLSLCNGRLKKFGDYDFFESIQVLTPTKKGLLGTKEMNKALEQELNTVSFCDDSHDTKHVTIVVIACFRFKAYHIVKRLITNDAIRGNVNKLDWFGSCDDGRNILVHCKLLHVIV